MRHKITLILSLFFISIDLFSQTYSNTLDDKIILEIITFEIDNSPKYNSDRKIGKKKINESKILWSEAMITLISEHPPLTFEYQFEALVNRDGQYNRQLNRISDFFNKDDINYLREQFENEIDTSWMFKSKKGKIKKNPRNNFYTYSNPLFDIGLTTALIYKEFYCGSLCAYGTVEVYRKENNKWKHFKTIPLWIS